MKTYRVENRKTKISALVDAGSAVGACSKMGWLIGDCFVQEISNVKSFANFPIKTLKMWDGTPLFSKKEGD